MPRAANRLSPLPVDDDQFLQYLKVVQDANDAGLHTLDEIAKHCLTSDITMANGSNYKRSNYRAVLGNLGRLGFIVEDDDNAQLREICKQYLNNEFEPNSKSKGHKQLHPFGILFLECMQEMGIENIDPYIIDQLSYFSDTIRKKDADFKWSNKLILSKTAERWPPKAGENPVDVDPVQGLTYLRGITPEGQSRIAQEYLKLLGVIGLIEKTGNTWKLRVDGDGQEYIRNVLRKLRFQKYLEDVIRQIGSNHEYLIRHENKNFFRAVGRYITYRYSGGIARQRGLRADVFAQFNRLRDTFQRDYSSKVKGAHTGRDLLSYVKDLHKIEVANISSSLSEFDDFAFLESALGSMSLEEICTFQEVERTPEDAAELLRSRGTSKRFSRLTLNRLQHQEGAFRVPSVLAPHRWQLECVQQWSEGDLDSGHTPFTGIASAVTGTGKTVMALMAASKFVESHPNAVISVVVPSKVLMYQWAEEAAKFLGLGADEIGFVGDGFSDSFTEGRRLIIWIVNSAVKENRLSNEIDTIGPAIPHMLVADECHEYGGEKYKLFLDCRAEGRLAISATPPDETSTGDKHPVLKTMGHQFYRLGYKQAYDDGLIAGFKIRYLGIELVHDERMLYTRLSDDIRRLSRELEEIYGPRVEGGNLFVRVQAIVAAGEGNATTAQYLRSVLERKELVRCANHRDTASAAILQHMHDDDDDDFTMLWFHEQINETTRLVDEGQGRRITLERDAAYKEGDEEKASLKQIEKDRLDSLQKWFMENPRVRPGMYHSKFPNPWGRWMVDWFRNRHLNVMLSAQALRQGFDLPSADAGMIRTSTSNVRQRIQTIGRIIRKKETGKIAQIWIVYVKDTTDEKIFQKHDWEDELPDIEDIQTAWELNQFGTEVNNARPEMIGGVEELPQPDRVLTEEELLAIDVEDLEHGEDYPDRRAIRSTNKIVRVSEDGLMTIMDGGAPFDFDYEPIQKASAWVRINRGRGQIHVLENGHAVARSQVGRVVFLANLDLAVFEDAVRDAVEEGDDFDTFMAGFKKT